MYTAVKPLSKYLQYKSVRIYDLIFTLHSKCTVALLLTCTFLLSAKQYFGEPIQCTSDYPNLDYVHSHCWTMGTYIYTYDNDDASLKASKSFYEKVTINYQRATYNRTPDASLLYIAEGILNDSKHPKKLTYLRYYQWVVLVLLLQSFMFYLPAFLWKIWEGNRLKHLCADLNMALVHNDKVDTRVKELVSYFTRDYKETHFRYFAAYILCEVLNFSISVVNILLLDVFLNGFWSRYVEALAAVPAYNWNVWNHISSRIFPKVAKCELVTFGPSGSYQIYDNLCLLPLNILNEKIFAFFWIWFILMTLLAGLKLLYRLLFVFHRGLRFQLMRAHARFVPKSQLKRILQDCNCGDWFVLMRVANNITPEIFRQLLQRLYEAQVPNKLFENPNQLYFVVCI